MRWLCYYVNKVREWHDKHCEAVSFAEHNEHDHAKDIMSKMPCNCLKKLKDLFRNTFCAAAFAEHGEHEEAKRILEADDENRDTKRD